MMRTIVRFSVILFLICVIASGLLAFINKLTTPKIIAQARAEEKNALKEVLPGTVNFIEVKKDGEVNYFKALDNDDKILGYCFLAKKYGYSSEIVTMVGITPDGKIIKIKILNQNETPGLGSRITEIKEKGGFPWFCEQFNSTDAISPKVDTITGATISSKAVIDSIKEKAKEVLNEILR